MESFFDWLSTRCVSFLSGWFGLSPATFGMGDFIFTVSLLTMITTVHLTLILVASSAHRNRKFKFKSAMEAKNLEILSKYFLGYIIYRIWGDLWGLNDCGILHWFLSNRHNRREMV